MKLEVQKTKLRSFFKKLALLAIIVLPVTVNAQTEWVKQFGGLSNSQGNAIITDGDGNVYTTGSFEGTVDFNPGAGTFNLSSSGLTDIFISKLDASGNFVWAKKMGASGDDRGKAIDIDGAGNIYTTGYFEGNVDFDPGAPNVYLWSAGGQDVFISKFDASGNFIWAKQMGEANDEDCSSIAVDGSGNVYTTGDFVGTVDFNPGSATFNLTATGFTDIFISKLNAAGNFVWAKQIAGPMDTERCFAIALDGAGNVYTTGSFAETVDFDPGVNTFNLTSDGAFGVSNIFICKLNVLGNFIWAKKMGGGNSSLGDALAIDVAGNIYTTGLFQGTVDFDPGVDIFNLTSDGVLGGGNIFISKLDASGDFVWAKQMGGTGLDVGKSIAVDGVANVYTTGYFTETVDFDPGTGIENRISAGTNDIFVSKLDSSGNFVWVKQMGGISSDYGYSIALDGADKIHTTGCFRGTVDFNPEVVGTSNLTSVGGSDAFVHKFSQCNTTFTTDVQTACNSYTWIDDITYTTSNSTARYTLVGVGGCDSIVALNLTISNSNISTDVINACGSHTWIDGHVYNSNNYSATWTLANSHGCDSIVTLNLTINNSNTGTDVQTACGSYTWIDGITYTASNNTATKTLTNVAGCDSVVTLNLTIKNSNTGTDVQTACNSYTWINGITYTASNNTATETLSNVAGCDSVVTLNLTIGYPNTGTDVQTACDSYTWIDGITYTASNNTATKILSSVAGCDSVVTLNLTMKNSSTGTDVQAACNSYTWIDGNTYTTSNNTATKTYSNAAGCDSIVTLNLTVYNSNTGTDVINACGSHTWIDGHIYNSNNYTATWTLANSHGCDSVVTLNLSLDDVNSNIIVVGNTIYATDASAQSYQWIDCSTNQPIPGATSYNYQVSYSGSFAVVVTKGACVDTSICVYMNFVGINELQSKNVSVYPNPVTDVLNIKVDGSSRVEQMEIQDCVGRVVHQSAFIEQIDFTELAAGFYYLKLSLTNNSSQIIKIIKQ